MDWSFQETLKPSPLNVRFILGGVLYRGRPTAVVGDQVYFDTVLPVDPAHPRLWPRAYCPAHKLVGVD